MSSPRTSAKVCDRWRIKSGRHAGEHLRVADVDGVLRLQIEKDWGWEPASTAVYSYALLNRLAEGRSSFFRRVLWRAVGR